MSVVCELDLDRVSSTMNFLLLLTGAPVMTSSFVILRFGLLSRETLLLFHVENNCNNKQNGQQQLSLDISSLVINKQS